MEAEIERLHACAKDDDLQVIRSSPIASADLIDDGIDGGDPGKVACSTGRVGARDAHSGPSRQSTHLDG